jgi:hypothetical protein
MTPRATSARPRHPRRRTAATRSATRALAVTATIVIAACGNWPPDENAIRGKFEVVVDNNSDKRVYRVFGAPDESEPSGRFGFALPGEEHRIRIGNATADDKPGGCFEQHLWLIVSRSDQDYQQGDISQYADDFEIIEHFRPGDCTDQEELRIEYNGS